MSITLTITAETAFEFQEQLQSLIKTTSTAEPTVQVQPEEIQQVPVTELMQEESILTNEFLPGEFEQPIIIEEDEPAAEELIENDQPEVMQSAPVKEGHRQFTIAQIGTAAKSLMAEMPELKPKVTNLLKQYNAKTLKDLDEIHYGSIALDLRELGALI